MASFQDQRQPYVDRRETGVELARRLSQFKGRDVFLVRKLGLRGHPELAMAPGELPSS